MTARVLTRLALSFGCALLVLAAIWLLLDRPPAQAHALFTTRTYPSAFPCNTTLQACISASGDGDSVLVSAGTYVTASLSITRAVNLIGAGVLATDVKLRSSGGRMIQYSAPSITAATVISNLTVENGDAGGSSGGGVRVLSGGAPLFYSVVVSNNVAAGGGGIRIIPTVPLTLVNVTVFSNTSTASGGGISAAGDLFVINSHVTNNSAAADGGGIHAMGALSVTNGFFNKNAANGGNGGSIYAGSNVTIELEGRSSVSMTVLSNGTAMTNGGAIFAVGGVRLIGAAFVTGNKALNGEGGAIYAHNLSDFSGASVLLQETFANNTALGNGGALRALGDVTLLNLPFFQNNTAGGGATADGGALYADGNVFLSRGSSTGNSARDGGAVYALGDIFFNVHPTGPGTAAGNGGCAYARKTITYNSAGALGCSAGQNGGAAFALQTVTLSANGVGVFHDNRSGNQGGMAMANTVVVRDALVFSNTAPLGGALVATKTLDIAGSTLMSNTAASFGGAAATITGTGTISNSIFSSNRVTGTSGIGGALWVTGTLNITGSTFLTNTAITNFSAKGGAAGASKRISLAGDTFQGNQAFTAGAIWGAQDVVAADSAWTDNGYSSNSSGGGIVALTATVTSISMTHNLVCCTGSVGGGISATLALISNSVFIQNSAFISGGALIATSAFITGSQFLSNTNSGGEGGAVWLRSGGTITGTQFIANNTICCSGSAGAVFARGSLLIFGSQFTGNSSGAGGALVLRGSQSEVHDSTFSNNFVDCCDGGGAIDAAGFFLPIINSNFSGNHVDCCDGGGAIRAADLLDVENSTFSNNSASGDGGAIKRLVASNNTTFITASTFISNYAGNSGGAVFAKQSDIEFSTFISNHVGSSAMGGAIASFGSGNIADSSFSDNRVDPAPGPCSSGLGGALFQDTAGFVTVQRSSFVRSSAPRGGAIFAGGADIEQSSFSDNSVVCRDSITLSNIGTGGAVDTRGALTVKRSSFVHNSAGSAGGGAISFLPFSANPVHIENSLFARNVATNTVFGAVGAAVAISGSVSTGQLFFNTFADQPRNPVSAIAIYTGTVSLVDNIISHHAIGIERTNGTVFEDFNLYFDNSPNFSAGVTSGGSSINNMDPLFLLPGADNYHVGVGSPALDAGSDLGITVDYDGDGRPLDAGFDIGFDERNAAAFRLYLPLLQR